MSNQINKSAEATPAALAAVQHPSAVMSRPDKATRVALQVLTGLTVAALAGVAGAISFAHMAALAVEHGQTGWKSSAFPVSVDGLELVASLYLLAQHRAGRHRVGVLPWAALLVGTAASLAANVAVGGHDLVGRALAGWPAISLLVSIKLLFSMFDHGNQDRPSVRDDQRTVPDGTAVPATAPGTVPAETVQSGTTDGPRTDRPAPSVSDADRVPGPPGATPDSGAGSSGAATTGGAVEVDFRSVLDLLSAARAARAAVEVSGRRLSRDALADQMRHDGHGVSNARACLLIKILRAEDNATPFGRMPDARQDGERDECREYAA